MQNPFLEKELTQYRKTRKEEYARKVNRRTQLLFDQIDALFLAGKTPPFSEKLRLRCWKCRAKKLCVTYRDDRHFSVKCLGCKEILIKV